MAYNPPTGGEVSTVEDTEDHADDEEIKDEEDLEEIDVGDEPTDAAAEPEPGAEVESIQDLLVKQEGRAEEEEEEEEDEALLALTPEERLEPLAVKVIPPQPSEFVCKKCYLVKHRSQLRDPKKMLCRDCA